jgi:hypothetical protein
MALSSIVFACVFGGALLGLLFRAALPDIIALLIPKTSSSSPWDWSERWPRSFSAY